MNILVRLLSFTVMSLVAAPAMAAGFIYDCTLTNGARSGTWVSPKLAVIVREDRSVHVIDEVLLGFQQSPKEAVLGRLDERVLVVRWSLDNAIDGKGQRAPRFDYDLRLNRKTGRISVGAIPYGYDNSFNGRGTCVKRTGEK